MSRYTIVRAGDAPDYTGGSPSPFLGYGRPLEAEQLGLNVRVLAPHAAHVPPNEDPGWGHSHSSIEEIYFVIEGEVAVKIDDEVLTLGPRDAVRLAPQARRAVRNDSDEPATLLMCSVKAQDPHAESQRHEGFWPAA
jgi:mannose-6-phosphate isomerase-like protein (cupin superfamily)